MRNLFLFISLFFVIHSSVAQVSFDKTKYDFGNLEAYSNRFVDIILKNNSDKQHWLLSVKKPFDVVYITSKQIMEKDSTIIVRLQVNPKEKGRFSYDVQIFTSDKDEATIVKLTGSLNEIDQSSTSAFTSCPDFSERPGGRNPNNFDLTVVTIDRQTREELSRSDVTLLQNGQAIWAKKTDSKGKIKAEATLGLSYFYATHEGYKPEELGAYINFKRNYIVLELDKDPRYCPPVPVAIIADTIIAEIVPEKVPEYEIEIEIEETWETDLASQVETSTSTEMPPAFTDLDKDNFEDKYFNPVNIVFVLDISGSMRDADKIELMKYSLFQLTEMLRPQDKMGIVTYATNSRVLLPPTFGNQKDAIKSEISALSASGATAGGEGIKLGFREAQKAFITNGTNHVIIITDGAFNRASTDYEKYIKKYAKKDIHMSVVGIKNKDVDKEKMITAAELGGGHYVPIFKLADAQNNLRQEIRQLSYIGQ